MVAINKELKNDLAINEYLDLIKEDRNLCGAYVSLAQYIDIIEKNNSQLQEKLDKINEMMEDLRSIYDYDQGVVAKEYLDCVDDVLERYDKIKGE